MRFLGTDASVDAQLEYRWQELEPDRDRYNLRPILEDLVFLEERRSLGGDRVLRLGRPAFSEFKKQRHARSRWIGAWMKIISGNLEDSRVQALLEHHARTARAETAQGSAHALDLDGLKSADVKFWSVWDGDTLMGVGALKRLSKTHGEIKSMHTVQTHRRLGVGSAILRHIIDAARAMGLTRLSLETGSWPYFQPAHALYRRHGFVECPPFGEYVSDANSVFMTLHIHEDHRGATSAD